MRCQPKSWHCGEKQVVPCQIQGHLPHGPTHKTLYSMPIFGNSHSVPVDFVCIDVSSLSLLNGWFFRTRFIHAAWFNEWLLCYIIWLLCHKQFERYKSADNRLEWLHWHIQSQIKLWYHYFLRNNYGIKVLYSCLCNTFPRLWYSISSCRVLPVNSTKLLSTWWNQAQYSLILVKYVRSSRARFLMHNPRHENINIYIFSMFIIRSCRLKFTYNWPIWKQVLMWIVHMCRRE